MYAEVTRHLVNVNGIGISFGQIFAQFPQALVRATIIPQFLQSPATQAGGKTTTRRGGTHLLSPFRGEEGEKVRMKGRALQRKSQGMYLVALLFSQHCLWRNRVCKVLVKDALSGISRHGGGRTHPQRLDMCSGLK